MTTSDDKPDTPEVEQDITVDVSDSATETAPEEAAAEEAAPKKGFDWGRAVGFVILPLIALLLGAAAGFLKWEDSSRRDADTARTEAVAAGMSVYVTVRTGG